MKGNWLRFFSDDTKYKNILENDGFVYEGRGLYAVIPVGITADLHRNVFYRKSGKDDWTYLGKGNGTTINGIRYFSSIQIDTLPTNVHPCTFAGVEFFARR